MLEFIFVSRTILKNMYIHIICTNIYYILLIMKSNLILCGKQHFSEHYSIKLCILPKYTNNGLNANGSAREILWSIYELLKYIFEKLNDLVFEQMPIAFIRGRHHNVMVCVCCFVKHLVLHHEFCISD